MTRGKSEIFNTDQGAQFTGEAFTGALIREGMDIRVNERGRALDNLFVAGSAEGSPAQSS